MKEKLVQIMVIFVIAGFVLMFWPAMDYAFGGHTPLVPQKESCPLFMLGLFMALPGCVLLSFLKSVG